MFCTFHIEIKLFRIIYNEIRNFIARNTVRPFLAPREFVLFTLATGATIWTELKLSPLLVNTVPNPNLLTQSIGKISYRENP